MGVKRDRNDEDKKYNDTLCDLCKQNVNGSANNGKHYDKSHPNKKWRTYELH